MGFLAAALILTAVAIAILSFPWWKPKRSRPNVELSAADLARELDDDVAVGMLAAEDLEPAARDLRATADTTAPSLRTRPIHRWRWVLALAIGLPLAAGVTYWHFGNWRFAFLGERAAVIHRADTMLAELQAYQQAHPDNMQGWINLGQGAEALGRYALAASAYARAIKLESTPDPDVLALWGEALLLSNPRNPSPQVQRIFKRVLALDPDNPRGLWYAGLLAVGSGQRDQAVRDWTKLLAQPNVPPQVAELIRAQLRRLGAPVAGTVASPPQGQNKPPG